MPAVNSRALSPWRRFWPFVLVIWAYAAVVVMLQFGIRSPHGTVTQEGDTHVAILLLIASCHVGAAAFRKSDAAAEQSEAQTGWVRFTRFAFPSHPPMLPEDAKQEWRREAARRMKFLLGFLWLPLWLGYVVLWAARGLPAAAWTEVPSAAVAVAVPIVLGFGLGLSATRWTDWLALPLFFCSAVSVMCVCQLLLEDGALADKVRDFIRGPIAKLRLVLRTFERAELPVAALTACFGLMRARLSFARGARGVALWEPIAAGILVGALHAHSYDTRPTSRPLVRVDYPSQGPFDSEEPLEGTEEFVHATYGDSWTYEFTLPLAHSFLNPGDVLVCKPWDGPFVLRLDNGVNLPMMEESVRFVSPDPTAKEARAPALVVKFSIPIQSARGRGYDLPLVSGAMATLEVAGLLMEAYEPVGTYSATDSVSIRDGNTFLELSAHRPGRKDRYVMRRWQPRPVFAGSDPGEPVQYLHGIKSTRNHAWISTGIASFQNDTHEGVEMTPFFCVNVMEESRKESFSNGPQPVEECTRTLGRLARRHWITDTKLRVRMP